MQSLRGRGVPGKEEADQNRRAARVPLEHKKTDLYGKAASYSYTSRLDGRNKQQKENS